MTSAAALQCVEICVEQHPADSFSPMRWVDDDVVEDSSGSAQGHVIPAFDSRVGVSDYLTFLLGHEDNDASLGKLASEERSVASRSLRRRRDEALRVEVVMRLDKESAEPAN